MTRAAPRSRATWAAIEPTPPAAPLTSTTSPSPTCAMSTMPWYAGTPWLRRCSGPGNTPSGTAYASAASSVLCARHPAPCSTVVPTGSPDARDSTTRPTAGPYSGLPISKRGSGRRGRSTMSSPVAAMTCWSSLATRTCPSARGGSSTGTTSSSSANGWAGSVRCARSTTADDVRSGTSVTGTPRDDGQDWGRRSELGDAAVHDELDARRVGRVDGEEERRRRDLVRCAHAVHGVGGDPLGDEGVGRLLRHGALQGARVDGTGADRVDPDAAREQLAREAAGQGAHGRLARRVHARVDDADPVRDRGREHDARAVGEQGRERLDGEERPLDVDGERLGALAVVPRPGRRRLSHAGTHRRRRRGRRP